MKYVTVHGMGTHYDLAAWKFTGADSPVLRHAGFGDGKGSYIAILKLGPTTILFLDTVGGYAPAATKDDCPILNAAVQRILSDFDGIPDTAHIEVSIKDRDYGGYDAWSKATMQVTPGEQFR